jgi:hypothetical protein
MKHFSGRRPSAALVVATLALFVALGGTTYAAVGLAPGSVGTRQLRNGAVTAAKVKPGALDTADFKAGTLLRGATGATGAPGAQGIPGTPGQPGLSASKYFATVADMATAVTGSATSAVRVQTGWYNVSFGSAVLTDCTGLGAPGENAGNESAKVYNAMTVATYPGLAWSNGSLVKTPNTVAVALSDVGEGAAATYVDSGFELGVFC